MKNSTFRTWKECATFAPPQLHVWCEQQCHQRWQPMDVRHQSRVPNGEVRASLAWLGHDGSHQQSASQSRGAFHFRKHTVNHRWPHRFGLPPTLSMAKVILETLGWHSSKITRLNLGGIRYGVARVWTKCFSFRNCRLILADSESHVVSNYSQHYHEERRGKIRLINFVIFYRNFFFLWVQALRALLEREIAGYFEFLSVTTSEFYVLDTLERYRLVCF